VKVVAQLHAAVVVELPAPLRQEAAEAVEEEGRLSTKQLNWRGPT